MRDAASYLWQRLAACAGLLGFASATHAGGSAPERHPVLLVHGIYDSALSMRPLGAWLRRRGWETHALSLSPNNGRAGLDELARQLAAFIDANFASGEKVDLVGFSMGGVVCRYYVQKLGGAERVGRFVAISAPHHGSRLAFLLNGAGHVQMRPGSAFLNELNANTSALRRVQFTSIWTPLDLTILPARSSRLPVGDEVRKLVLLHPLMILQPGCLRAVAQALAAGLEPVPRPRAPEKVGS